MSSLLELVLPIVGLGLVMITMTDALIEYRSTYGTSLQAPVDYLLAPAGFWGHSAEGVDDERYLEADD